MASVRFERKDPGTFEVWAGGRVIGWLEDAGLWTWLPDRRIPGIQFKDRVFGRDIEKAKQYIRKEVAKLP